MTLLVTAFAAVICTALWYKNVLCWLFWGASLMWLVDAIFEYRELGAEYFTPSPEDLLNDLFLGLSVVALGLIIWIIVLLIRDPRGVLKAKLYKK